MMLLWMSLHQHGLRRISCRLATEKIGLPLNGTYTKTVYSPQPGCASSSSFDVAF